MIALEHVSVRFDGVAAVDDVSLHVPRGSSRCSGPAASGSPRSCVSSPTLLRSATGVEGDATAAAVVRVAMLLLPALVLVASVPFDDVRVAVKQTATFSDGRCVISFDVAAPHAMDEGRETRQRVRVVRAHVGVRRRPAAHLGHHRRPIVGVDAGAGACEPNEERVVGGTDYLVAVPAGCDDADVARVKQRGKDLVALRMRGRTWEVRWTRADPDNTIAWSKCTLIGNDEMRVTCDGVIDVIGAVWTDRGRAFVVNRGGGKYSGGVTLDLIVDGTLVPQRFLASWGC